MTRNLSSAAQLTPDKQRATVRTITLRLMPLIFVAYVVAYVDRVNLGFAQLTMGQELGIKTAAYGLAASIFFIAYFFFEVPSNVLLRKFGARKWIARIMVSWGIVTALTAFVSSIELLYVARFLLGVAEAGFFPGMIYLLTQWFRKEDRAKALGWLIFAQPIAFILGGAFGGLILDNIHWFGMSSWKWVFIFTGVPAVLLGFVVFFVLPDDVWKARWLSDEQKVWMTSSIDDEQGHASEGIKEQLAAFKNGTVLHLSAVHLIFATGSYGFNLFLPLIIKQINPSYSATNIGFVAAVPYIFAAIGIALSAGFFERARRKTLFVAVPCFISAVGLSASILLKDNAGLALVAICVTAGASFAFITPFWAVTTLRISRTQAAVAIAAINSIGNLGGFFGPYIVGRSSGSTVTSGMLIPILAYVAAGVLILFLRKAGPAVPRRADDGDAVAAERAEEAR